MDSERLWERGICWKCLCLLVTTTGELKQFDYPVIHEHCLTPKERRQGVPYLDEESGETFTG